LDFLCSFFLKDFKMVSMFSNCHFKSCPFPIAYTIRTLFLCCNKMVSVIKKVFKNLFQGWSDYEMNQLADREIFTLAL